MSDIFISYAREDRARVTLLAEALSSGGLSVWWDPEIPAGGQFDRVIEEALKEAHCVLVVWSRHAVNSDWVRAEASYAHEHGRLIPVQIDDARPPLAFRQVQSADLTLWRGERSAAELKKLIRDIEAIISGSAMRPQEIPPASPGSSYRPARWVRRPIAVGALLAGLVGSGAAYVVWERHSSQEPHTAKAPAVPLTGVRVLVLYSGPRAADARKVVQRLSDLGADASLRDVEDWEEDYTHRLYYPEGQGADAERVVTALSELEPLMAHQQLGGASDHMTLWMID